MISRRRLLGGLGSLAGAGALALAGCSSESDGGGSAASTSSGTATTIRLNDGGIYQFAYENGALDDALDGYDVSFDFYEFTSGPAMNEAFAAGELDFAAMNHFPAFTGASAYGTTLLATLNTTEVDGVLVATPASGIESVEDLAGKQVGTYIGGSYHYCTCLYLEQAGLTLDDIELLNTTTETVSSLRTGTLDAGVISYTQAVTLEEEGTANIVATTTGELTFTTLVGLPDFITANPDLTTAFIKSYDEAQRYVDENREAYLSYYEDRTGGDSSAMAATWDIYDRFLTIPGPEQLASAERLLAWMQENDYADASATVEGFFDTSYAEAAGLETSA